jgi:hypothetical protein
MKHFHTPTGLECLEGPHITVAQRQETACRPIADTGKIRAIIAAYNCHTIAFQQASYSGVNTRK